MPGPDSAFARFRAGEYLIFSSLDSVTKEYLGVNPKHVDRQGSSQVVLLPAKVNPENPDPCGPTQVSTTGRLWAVLRDAIYLPVSQWVIVERKVGDEVFYSLQTADRRNIDILDDKVVVVPSQSITERRRLDQSGVRLRHFESTRGTSRMASIDSMYVHSL